MAKKGEIARKGKSSCIIISAGYSVVGHYNFLASVSLFVCCQSHIYGTQMAILKLFVLHCQQLELYDSILFLKNEFQNSTVHFSFQSRLTLFNVSQ